MSEELKLSGKIIDILKVENGVSKAGKEWSNKTFVIETSGEYPKQVAFTLFGDKTSYTDKFSIGSQVEVKFSVESREYNGRWLTNVNAYSIYGTEQSSNNSLNTGLQQTGLPPSEEPVQEDDGDILPF